MYVQATMTKMIAHCTQGGESIGTAVDWAASEIEGFSRMLRQDARPCSHHFDGTVQHPEWLG
jgi:hypothetical protein